MQHCMEFTDIEYWVFDLDNTLYPREVRLFDQIEARMEQFIMRELGVDQPAARQMRADFWRDHGTTLVGLMTDHGVDPDPFLDEVHDIDLSHMPAGLDLLAVLERLPGQRVIYTNGSRHHGEKVSQARGIRAAFHGVYGIEDAAYRPKPHQDAFMRVFDQAGIDPRRAVMIEDDPRNLEVPAALGMVTVLVGETHDGAHIHHCTDDLTGFLTTVAAGLR